VTTAQVLRKEKRERLVVRAVAGISIFALGGAVWAVVGTAQNTKEITQIQHSACQVDPAGRECQQTKREASLASNLAVTCIPFAKAGYPCPKPGSTVAKRHSKGVTPSTGTSPHSQPPPSSGGGPGHSGGPPHSGSPVPLTPPPAPAPSPQPGNSENAHPQSAPLAPVLEQVTPPAAAPAVESVCDKAAAVAAVC
jgi:hypothetical protein